MDASVQGLAGLAQSSVLKFVDYNNGMFNHGQHTRPNKLQLDDDDGGAGGKGTGTGAVTASTAVAPMSPSAIDALATSGVRHVCAVPEHDVRQQSTAVTWEVLECRRVRTLPTQTATRRHG